MKDFSDAPGEKQRTVLELLYEYQLEYVLASSDLQYDTIGERFCLSSEVFEEILFELYGKVEVKKILDHQSPNQEEKSPYPEVTTLQFLLTQMELMDQILGRVYQKLDQSKIGRGSTATVVFATDNRGNERALKIYKPEEGLSEAQMSCIQRECRAAQQLRENKRFVPLRRLYKASEKGIRFRDSEGRVHSLDDKKMAEISKGYELYDTSRRVVMEMDRIPGHELGEVKKIREGLVKNDLEKVRTACEQERGLFTPEEYEEIQGFLLKTLTPESARQVMEIYTTAVVRVVSKAAGIVQELHDGGFYHTDLKPESFMISDSTLVMHDLGSAIEWNNHEPVHFLFSPDYVDFNFFDGALDRTEEHEEGVKITPQKYFPSDDVFLLGGTLYSLLTGENRSITEYIPGARINEAIDLLLEAILKKSLTPSNGNPDQSDRFRSAAEFQFALECSLALKKETLQQFISEKLTQPLSKGEQEVRQDLPDLGMKEFGKALKDIQNQLTTSLNETGLPLIDQLYRLLLVARSAPDRYQAIADDEGKTVEEALEMFDEE